MALSPCAELCTRSHNNLILQARQAQGGQALFRGHTAGTVRAKIPNSRLQQGPLWGETGNSLHLLGSREGWAKLVLWPQVPVKGQIPSRAAMLGVEEGNAPPAHLYQGGRGAQGSLRAGHGLAGQGCPGLLLHCSRNRVRGQKCKVRSEGSAGGGNLGETCGGTGGCGAVLTGVRVPIAARGGWAPRGLGEAVGPLRDGAAGTSALPFRSLWGDGAEGGTQRHHRP